MHNEMPNKRFNKWAGVESRMDLARERMRGPSIVHTEYRGLSQMD